MTVLIRIASICLLFSATISAQAAIVIYTDFASWAAAHGGPTEQWVSNAVGVGQANEVASDPVGNNVNLGVDLLTFDSANTGLQTDFSLTKTSAADSFVFNDCESGGCSPIASFTDALSIGDINNNENDDILVTATSGPLLAMGFFLGDNEFGATETLEVRLGAVVLTTFSTEISALGDQSGVFQFIGIVSDTAFDGLFFNEGSGGDDMTIQNVVFGLPDAVPAPLALFLVVAALGGVVARKVRR